MLAEKLKKVKVENKRVRNYILLIVFGIIIMIQFENWRLSLYSFVSIEDEISLREISGLNNRGRIAYEKHKFVGSGMDLISMNKTNQKMSDLSVFRDHGNQSLRHSLYDVKGPYWISKKANTDTIEVLKIIGLDTCKLQFLIPAINPNQEEIDKHYLRKAWEQWRDS